MKWFLAMIKQNRNNMVTSLVKILLEKEEMGVNMWRAQHNDVKW